MFASSPFSGSALFGQALSHLWLCHVCSHSSLPRLGLAASGSLQHWVLETWAPGLRGGRYTEAWTQENPSLSPGPTHSSPSPQAGSLLPGLGLQHPHRPEPRPGWGECSRAKAQTLHEGQAWPGPRALACESGGDWKASACPFGTPWLCMHTPRVRSPLEASALLSVPRPVSQVCLNPGSPPLLCQQAAVALAGILYMVLNNWSRHPGSFAVS